MHHFDIVKKSMTDNTFRSQAIKDKYDIQNSVITERFVGDIDLSADWQIGIIWGNSGTGKTTIAKEIFKSDYFVNYRYTHNCVLDDFPKDIPTKKIFSMLNSVGFSSPPSWLKPYKVLSTGEQMRINLARSLLANNNTIVFDEFTSVVDRNIAKIGSFAISKAIKKTKKRFVAVTCHSDVTEWLLPDWEFCTNNMQFSRRLLRRPEIKINIYKEKNRWGIFRKYHYLNHDLNNTSDQYVAYIDNTPIAFCAILHQPHAKVRNLKRCSRLVVLPDYQGIGVGGKLLDFVAKLYIKNKFRFIIVTTNPALNYSLKKNSRWKLKSTRRKSLHSDLSMFKTSSSNRRTFSWEYK